MNFKQRFFGKCILAGEHSVLRGSSALVFPLRHFFMDLEYEERQSFLELQKGGDFPEGLEFCVSPLLDQALGNLDKKREDLRGVLRINSFIPFGAGLGASAVLSVALSCLMRAKKWLKDEEAVQGFSTQLENIFHGTSSGMDVAAVLKEQPLLYQEGIIKQLLPLPQNPCRLFLSYSGALSSTSFAVKKVKDFFIKYPEKGKETDKDMEYSVSLIQKALYEVGDRKQQNLQIKQAFDLAAGCFIAWDLMSADLTEHINKLKSWGALAAKPTGSGEGGFVISLWEEAPPSHKGVNFIPLF
ncbi:MAG: hypothetical protein OXB86_05065 [Bdellovibrionales bacterium]|nr:hypothetical protein [Bdellovibrionales bacterium]